MTHLYEILEKGKTTETECRSVIPGGPGVGEKELTSKGHE